ncbi:microsomal glutathione S-transferase 1-like [Ylistrum balloti]|uniref:microsomal glutathione S-transferase 1-like n=1 Tax=Ylistrum balloti TaxID=509963 RepID=UPI002905E62F|nr:microsomal glutathione S-transferase 1-like [Ylistrum balloti]
MVSTDTDNSMVGTDTGNSMVGADTGNSMVGTDTGNSMVGTDTGNSMVVANMEDRLVKGQTTIFNDIVVERTRRCHQNDVENVIPFVLVGVLYVLTEPDPWWAAFHFRMFTFCRICHTLAYLFAIPQPARASMFGFGWFTVASMGVSVLLRGKF